MVNINSFQMETVQGSVDLNQPGFVISAQVSTTEAAALVAGQPVKRVNSYNKLPEITALTANTDEAFGYVVRNQKDASAAAGSIVEIALQGTIMYMTAGAAIAANAAIEVVYTTNKVITNAGTNPVAGVALDRASADGDLIRVFVITPAFASSQTIADVAGLQAALDTRVVGINNTVTLAEVNAGKTLVTVATGKKAIVTDFIARCNGAFGALTSINLKVGSTSVAALAQAQLTNGAILNPNTAGTTLGAGFGIAGGDGDDITVDKTGSAGTGATDIKFTVSYYLIDA